MNKYELICKIKSKGFTIERFCKEAGISRSAFYRKCDHDSSSEFTVSEIQKIMDMLELDSPMGIFFADKVS